MKFSNFILEYDGLLTKEECDDCIKRADEFEVLAQNDDLSYFLYDKGSNQFPDGRLGRSDFQVYLNMADGQLSSLIRARLLEALSVYADEVQTLKQQVLCNDVIKLQKTHPQGGYSVWHIEQGDGESATRSLVWMIYLNEVESGGTTEFLYQGMTCEPEIGKCVIWPAGVTHPHRGNPPYSGNKYVLTGWFSNPYHESTIAMLNDRNK